MPKNTNMVAGAAAIVSAAALAVTGASLANADTQSPTATSTPSASSSQSTGGDGKGQGRGAGHAHTAVPADEAAKVKAAVIAKDSAITVTEVFKVADGSYHVRGTKAGASVRVRVSKDLATVTVLAGRGDGAKGSDHGHTAVPAAEAAKVKAAVVAKDSAITVTEVFKVADGSYHVRGTKAGASVRVRVSKDLATVTVLPARGERGKGGGHGGRHGGGSTGTATTAPTATATS